MFEFVFVTKHIARLELPLRLLDLPIWVADHLIIPVAVWLVWGKDGWTLIDTGVSETAGAMIEAILKITGGASPTRVLITHGHFDHAGGLPAIHIAWNPPAFCHRQELQFIAGPKDYIRLKSSNPFFLLGRLLMEPITWAIPGVIGLDHGDMIGDMQVIHLPGHSPGHVAYLHITDRALICGDAVMNLGGKLTPPFRLATPAPNQAFRSIRRMSAYDFNHLLPSHGSPIMKVGRRALLSFITDHPRSQSRLRFRIPLINRV
jgi:glyoxylase-like metal-dependent hydrolase (beta-lactamase superfamily II)